MTLREVTFGSDTYRRTLELREQVLRLPIGLLLAAEDTAQEERQWHFVMEDNASLIACVVIKPLGNDRAKLRQMAVLPAWQGRSVGRQLIACVEGTLADRGIHLIEMSARQSAVGFYEKLGYSTCGDGYSEQGVPHIRMEKTLR